MVEQLLIEGFVFGAAIALMAVGLTLIFSVLWIVNYAHGEMYMFGAAIVYLLLVRYQVTNYIVACLVAVVTVGLLGWVLDKIIFRRFHANLMGGVIAAIGLLLIFQTMMWPVLGPVQLSVPTVVEGMMQVFGVNVSLERLVVVAMSVVVILSLTWFIKYTKMGKAIRAVQQDAESASTKGVSVHNVAAVTFAIATALAALAGALIAPLYLIEPPMGFMPLEFAFIVIILGGMGSIMGSFIASFIIGIQYILTSAFLGIEWALTLSFVLAMVVLLVRPRGLMGQVGRVAY
jgi:branched-chain amino acid transport system permease protein